MNRMTNKFDKSQPSPKIADRAADNTPPPDDPSADVGIAAQLNSLVAVASTYHQKQITAASARVNANLRTLVQAQNARSSDSKELVSRHASDSAHALIAERNEQSSIGFKQIFQLAAEKWRELTKAAALATACILFGLFAITNNVAIDSSDLSLVGNTERIDTTETYSVAQEVSFDDWLLSTELEYITSI